MNNTELDLMDARKEIDAIDDRLCELFGKRLDLSEKIAKIKATTGDDIYKPEREAQILERISKKVPDERKELYKQLFEEIMRISRECQTKTI